MKRFVIFFMLSIVAIGVAACRAHPEEDNNGNTYTVYLANSQMNGLVATKVSINASSTENIIDNIINILKEGNKETKPSVPTMLNVINVKIDKRNAVISFDDTYSKMTTVEEIICRSAIVKSVTDMPDIDTVEFYIGSIPYQNANGTVQGAMGPDDVILDMNETNNVKQKKVTLYFADKEGQHLVPVDYEIDINSEEQIEKAVLNLLIKGPTDSNLIATIPSETMVKNVYTTEGICYVDLNEEFITKHMGGSTSEMLTIYSIVNTLTELNNINKVQFLIEGTKRAEFKGHFEFDGLFQRNLDLIAK